MPWPRLEFAEWQATCDTLHAHSQVLGKIAAALAPPEPQLQHAALRLTARGWETQPLPAPNGSGSVVVILHLHQHATVVENSDGRTRAVPLTPNRSVGAVTREVVAALGDLVGPVPFDPRPQETPWSVPLDEDEEHSTFDTGKVGSYFEAATAAASILTQVRAPYRGRSTPVNAWWGSFDLAVSLFSGLPADPGSTEFIQRNSMDAQEIAIGWWPGDPRYPRAAFYAYAHPAPPAYGGALLDPPQAHWDGELNEYIMDWADVVSAERPDLAALTFARSALDHLCSKCDWDPALAASLSGSPPPLR